jgi:amino acid adenylation domain-containing protein/non-ribosomal peptide synthase protein (TIGR01720 family)
MVLLAAFQVLLHRYTGQDDILVGFPKAGRSQATARIVGYFVNPVVMRADFTGNPRFADLLTKNQQAFAEGSAHDWYPFAHLVQRIRPTRDPSRSPIFQVMFSWQKTTHLLPSEQAASFAFGQADHAVDLGGLIMRPIPMTHRVAPFDLTMSATEVPGGLLATMEYKTDLFDAPTIARMAQSYRTLLESITRDPQQVISALPIMPDIERQKVLRDWNATTAPYPSQLCLHQLFEQQVEQTPEALAVVCDDEQLTYRHLNQRANQLAHLLQQHGIGPDALVGLYMERSAELLIGVLAILKAGGAYVPLDPSYPHQRLAFMLKDTNMPLLITQRALQEHFPSFGGTLVCLEDDAALISQQPQDNPASSVTPDHLAYLMYTSGSTGQPNGVALAHRGVVSLLTDFQRRQPIAPGDACSWWTSSSFDVSVSEIFSAWLAGGTLHVIPELARLDGPALLEWLHRHQIRSAYLPPFLLADLEAWLHSNPTLLDLRRLLVGVEPIPEQLLLSISSQLPDLYILNGYGPTETTICSTLYHVTASGRPHGMTPIGKPVANTQIYLLDRHLQPVPVGAVGEVYIAGVGLARGYLNRSQLTAERFLPNPFSSQPGARLYSTGDLARYLPDGTLEFLGRRDSQVKLHGTRIELGEIEATLAQHPQVKQALVLLRRDPRGNKRLITYLVPVKDPAPSPNELRAFLAQRLPNYLVPSAFVVRDSFPMTPSGKVDRRALPAPETLRPEYESALQEPRTNTEQIVATIWQEVLGVEQVGVNDNFFELGGDSILCIQIIARATDAGLHLTPRQMFQAPTVAGLAALAESSTPMRVQPEQGVIEGEMLLTPVQLWFFEHNFPDPSHWNQALMCITREPLDHADLPSAVAALLAHHDALRLRYTMRRTGWQQTYAGPSSEVPCQVFDLSSLPEPQQTMALEEHAAALQSSLNLSIGPLIRVAYFDLGATRPGRLFIVIHHLVIDGISWRILLEDLQTVYRQLQSGLSIQLPPKTTPFRDWAGRLVDLAQSSQITQEASFWLHTAPTDLPSLPVDLPSSDHNIESLNTEATSLCVSVSLSREETRALLHEVPGAYGTEVNDVLLSALALAFRRWTGSSTLWIDLEGHGREDIFDDIDLSRSVGWFTTIYPLRLDLPPTAELNQIIQSVKEQLRRIPSHGLGYGLLRYLCSDPALAEQFRTIPPAQVSFNYLGQFHQAAADELCSFPALESIGPLHSPDASRSHLLEINATIIQSELRIDWTYSSHVHHRHTVERVAGFFIDELRALIAHCSAPASIGYTRTDFPNAELNQAELETLLTASAQRVTTRVKRNIADVYPLSPMQQGMLFHTLSAPESGMYIEQTSCTIEGLLDVPAFERAWQRALDRHSMLRTSFVWKRLDRMLQVVHKDVKLPLELRDWRQLSAAEQQTRFKALLTAQRRRGFDLTRAPLLRLIIVRTGDETYRFLLNYHHALLDGWSLTLLFKEIFTLYGAFISNQDLLLPHARPYRDYIAWLQTQDLGAAEAYWHQALSGFTAAPALPVQRMSSPVATPSQPSEQEARLPTQTTSALQSLAHMQHFTLNTIVQGSLALLLSRYSQQDEVLFGTTVAGRSPDLSGVETMIGLFINTLPLRVRLDPQSHLLEWLQQVQNNATEARQYDYSPLVHIHAWSDRPRGTSLFETILVFENYPIDAVLHEQLGGLLIRDIRSIEQTNYPLTVVAVPGEQLQLKIVYDRERFEPAVITCFLGHLCQLLESIATDPDQNLATVSMLTKPERQQVLQDWNATAAPYPSQLCLHQLFEQQVEQTPEVLALVCDDEQLTYRQLNQRANQLAHLLQQHGIGPDTLVGLYCERSAQLLIGVLAILKAGGAYVPLDPSYPDERLAFMLHDTNTPLLLTQRALRERLPSFEGMLVCLEADESHINQHSETNPTSPVSPDNLAYLMYTSGSTGRPNGVALAHRGAVSLLTDFQRRQPIAAGDTCSWWTSSSFDVSVYELFSAWLAGGTLYVIPESVRLDGPALLEWLHDHQICSAYLPPFLLADLEAWLKRSPTLLDLRRLLVGVEPIPEQLLLSISSQLPDLCILNGYGPTETTICSTLYHVTASGGPSHRTTPIGKPVANTQIYLLDRHLQPVPVGVVGEVYIAGVGLARGYLNRPQLTAERFLPNPFSTQPGARLYRTGDLARYLADGTLEFLGRRDSQVKLHGTRIELGEIEATLAQHPQVKQAAVLLRQDPRGNSAQPSGQQSLVAIWTPRGEPVSAAKLRKFLRVSLPRPLIPASFVRLDTLPLLPSGKLDRLALHAFAETAIERESVFTPPNSPLEQYLAQLWKELLKIEQVGRHDDFFALGGNSLLGAVLINRLQEALKENVALVAVFEAPTIAELASYLEERHPDGIAVLLGTPVKSPSKRKANAEEAMLPTVLVPIQPKGTRPPLFCIHPAGGVVYPYYTLVPLLGKDQPLYGVQDPGLYDRHPPFTSIEDMAASYVEALKTVQSAGPYHLMGWSVGGMVAYEMAQQLTRQGEVVAVLIMLDTHAPVRRKPLEPRAALRVRLKRIASWAQVLPRRIREAGFAINPILTYVQSGLFLLAASSRQKRAAADKKPTVLNLLRWAMMDTWRARLLNDAEVAATVSQETSLLLIELPAVRRVMELVREHRRLARRYCAQGYPGQITLLRATPAKQREQQDRDPTVGWGKLAESGVEIHPIQANHVALLVKPYVEVLAQELRACLDRVRSSMTDATDMHEQPHT